MGKARRPKRVKLIIGMLAKDKKLFGSVEEFFVKEFGEIDHRSKVLPFRYTSYYEKEMGCPLKRRFISFGMLITPSRLAKIKIITNNLEEKFSVKQKGSTARKINIDPGYISDSKLVLATTKDFFHRIYLNNGIYAEVTLTWRKGTFQPFDWTYPDYRTQEYIGILNSIRNAYMEQRNR